MPLLLLIALSCALVGWAIIYLAAKVERRRTEARPSVDQAFSMAGGKTKAPGQIAHWLR